MRSRCKVDLRSAVAVAAVLVLLAAILPAAAMPRNIKLGDAVGRVKGSDIDGRPLDSDAWKGAPAVWLFVAAEQASSQKAQADLQAALDNLVGSEIRAVALTPDAVKVASFRELRSRLNIRYPLVIDAGREVYGRIGIIVLPTTLIIDREGKLAHVIPGWDLSYGRTLEARLARMAGRISADEEQRRLATTQPVRDPKRDRAERLCRSAEIMVRRGLRAEAIAELQRAIEADATYGNAYIQLARLRLMGGDVAAAEKLIEAVRQRDAANRMASLELGTIRFRQGRLDEAETLLREALVLNPDPARTYYWLGRVYLARDDSARAAENFRAAVERLAPDLAEPTAPDH